LLSDSHVHISINKTKEKKTRLIINHCTSRDDVKEKRRNL